jgi:hypothetical protein
MPIMKAAERKHAEVVVHAHSAIASALQAAAATMAQRSPRCMVISEAGMLLTSEPTPISVTTSAAIGTDAPSSRAVSGTTGQDGPFPQAEQQRRAEGRDGDASQREGGKDCEIAPRPPKARSASAHAGAVEAAFVGGECAPREKRAALPRALMPKVNAPVTQRSPPRAHGRRYTHNPIET